jgi:hypothetical protein
LGRNKVATGHNLSICQQLQGVSTVTVTYPYVPGWNLLCTRCALSYHSSTKYLFCNQRLNGIAITLRETQGPDDTPKTLEAERAAAQEFMDTVEPLSEEEQPLKEKYTDAGFHA